MQSNQLRLIQKVQGISLKWKLLIPFLFFAFTGTSSLLYLSFVEQKRLIETQEGFRISKLYHIFLSNIKEREGQCKSLATMISLDRYVIKLMAERDREGLYQQIGRIYPILRDQFGIYQLHFHSPGARSFLRVHSYELHGESLDYRLTVLDVQREKRAKGGLEWGLTGLSIRGVAPIVRDNELLGSVDVGIPLDHRFLSYLKGIWNVDFVVYEYVSPDSMRLLASTIPNAVQHLELLNMGISGPAVMVSPKEYPHETVLVGPLRDPGGKVVALLQINMNRSEIIREVKRARDESLIVALVGILVSSGLTWVVASFYVKPIKEVVAEANEIAEGRREVLLRERPNDEMGVLTRALNRLLTNLLLKRQELQEYANMLEQRVMERTKELISSEEKYRTLVEHLPLVVYRLLKDGTVEFINNYFTEKLGYTVEEVVSDREFWWRVICAQDPGQRRDVLEHCWSGKELKKERVVVGKNGEEFVFIDHIIPIKDNGNVIWIDGIMVDITELKRLQAQIIEAEEVRTLKEISARFAHEIRNPITAAGGFARRLYQSLPEDSPQREAAKVIVEEMLRLESVLKTLLTSIKPVELKPALANIVSIIERAISKALQEVCNEIRKEGFYYEFVSLPKDPMVVVDSVLMEEVFYSTIVHGVFHMPQDEVLKISIKEIGVEGLEIGLSHKAKGIAKVDVSEFFLPRVSPMTCTKADLLPRAKMIVQRHGGKAQAFCRDDELVIVITIPRSVASTVMIGA